MILEQRHRDTFTSAFDYFFEDNDASNLCLMLLEVAHIWDDMVDKDKDISPDNINTVFKYLVYDIPINPIYRRIPSLPDHMLSVYLQWRDATNIENDGPSDDDLNKCYVLRAGIYDIFSVIAYYLRGDTIAKEIGPAIRRLYGETLDVYKEEFKNA